MIGNALHYHTFFQKSRLGIGTVQHRTVRIGNAVIFHLVGNIVRNVFRLFIGIVKLPEMYPAACSFFRPEGFFLTASVVTDHRVGRIQDVLGGSVVLFQLNHLCIGIYLLVVQNITDIGTAEFVDGLVIITYHTQIAITVRQQTDQFELRCIGILVLIHHDIFETFLIIIKYFRAAFEQFHSLYNNIIKIQCITLFQGLLILSVDLGDHGFLVISHGFYFKFPHIHQLVLGGGNFR